MNIHHDAFLCNERWLSSIPKGIGFASMVGMSRVEPKEEKPAPREAEGKPSQAEGDEETVDEALKREEPKRPED
jgi:hypothetical protein